MFINDDFLLQSELAVKLYKSIRELPIIDFHNHLDPKEIYENLPYTNISNIWLDHDHYKWRLMRNSGIDEDLITGKANVEDKFSAFTKALEGAFMNPLHHWSHMELKQYFGIEDVLTSANASAIYKKANMILAENPRGPRDFLDEMSVEIVCTTDDLLSDLKYHKLIKEDKNISLKVLPTFRPDRLLKTWDDDFLVVITELEKLTRTTITGISTLTQSLSMRLDYFQEMGCMFSDHGLSNINYHQVSKKQASEILKRRLLNQQVSIGEAEMLQIYILQFLIKEYGRRNIACQFHIGALRNQNQRMFKKIGKDTGYDSISNYNYIEDVNNLLSDCGLHFDLPQIIVFNLNPKDNEAIASLCGNFSAGAPGKIQLGAPWWFNDHHNGIKRHLDVYSEYLNISYFKGMLTDSRSYLSFVRHDYFRRILANYVSEKVHQGIIPKNMNSMIKLVSNISYYNILMTCES